jgi:competence protein ComEC
MKSLRAIGMLAIVCLAISTAAWADYLTVERAANIRAKPTTNSQILFHPPVGANLELLDNGNQKGGYYHTVDPNSARKGWIYRTLVSVQSGTIPSTTPPASAPDSSPPPTTPPTVPSAPTIGSDTMTAHYINMGQGNATLLEFSCGAVLVDAGGEGSTTTDGLIDYLQTFFARRTDLHNAIATIFITHTHIDHNAALRAVVEHFTVNNYVFNGHLTGSGHVAANWMVDHANDNGRNIKIEKFAGADINGTTGLTDAVIDPVQCPGTDPTITLLAGPLAENPGWDSSKWENNSSLVIRVDFGKSSFIFPGDEQIEAIDALLAKYAGTDELHVGVYEVGHHGAENGTEADQLRVFSPQLAVISAGVPTVHKPFTTWQYGHPRKVTVDLLNGAITRTRASKQVLVAPAAKTFITVEEHQAVYSTSWDGNVDVMADAAGNYTVTTER